MITTTQMYWLTRLDRFTKEVPEVLAVILFVAIVFAVVKALINYEDTGEFASSLLRKVLLWVIAPILLAIAGLTIFVPTTKEMAAIIVVPKIVNNEKVQQAGDQLCQLATEWMEELHPKKKGGEK